MSASTRTHVVTGDRGQVQTALEVAYAAGRLVDVREFTELDDARVRVVAELREPAPATAARWAVPAWLVPRWPARPWLLAARVVGVLAAGAGATAVVLAVVALVTTVVGAIAAALAWVSANLALILAVGVALVLVLGGGATCAGLHCGGCRR